MVLAWRKTWDRIDFVVGSHPSNADSLFFSRLAWHYRRKRHRDERGGPRQLAYLPVEKVCVRC